MDLPHCPALCLVCLGWTAWYDTKIICCKTACRWEGVDSKVSPEVTWKQYQHQVAALVDLKTKEEADQLKRMLVIEPGEAVRPITLHRRRLALFDGNHQQRKAALRALEDAERSLDKAKEMLSDNELALLKRNAELDAIRAQKSREAGLDREPKAKQRKQPDRDLMRKKRAAARKARKVNR